MKLPHTLKEWTGYLINTVEYLKKFDVKVFVSVRKSLSFYALGEKSPVSICLVLEVDDFVVEIPLLYELKNAGEVCTRLKQGLEYNLPDKHEQAYGAYCSAVINHYRNKESVKLANLAKTYKKPVYAEWDYVFSSLPLVDIYIPYGYRYRYDVVENQHLLIEFLTSLYVSGKSQGNCIPYEGVLSETEAVIKGIKCVHEVQSAYECFLSDGIFYKQDRFNGGIQLHEINSTCMHVKTSDGVKLAKPYSNYVKSVDYVTNLHTSFSQYSSCIVLAEGKTHIALLYYALEILHHMSWTQCNMGYGRDEDAFNNVTVYNMPLKSGVTAYILKNKANEDTLLTIYRK